MDPRLRSVLLYVAGVGALSAVTWKALDFLFPWLKYDIKVIRLVLSATRQIKQSAKRSPAYTIVEKLIDQAKSLTNKTFIYYEDDVWSYQGFNEYCNQIARAMHEEGYVKSDVVAIFMYSCPDYIGTWFGLAKMGVISAFINNNLRGNSLMHCLKISKCKAIVVPDDRTLIKALDDVKEDLEKEGIDVYVFGNVDGKTKLEYKNLNSLIATQPKDEVPPEWRQGLTLKDDFCYVYTSGTTGLPKAAVIRHDRTWLITRVLLYGNCCFDDIVYSPLPLYHAASGVVGVLGTLNLGCTIVIRKKFSASHFWDDCRRYKATFAQYIGETIRYVCDQPPHSDDKNHNVRIIMGNGLRPLVWKNFLDRFGKNIHVMELYGATEGNAFFANLANKVGSVGILSPLFTASGLLKLVKYDMENDEIVRDKNGRCIEVPYGTAGLLICKITERTMFNGYHRNKKQTERKILRNAFRDGDAFFNSGDLLRRDSSYHLYFVDRIGDTFRWKGENVSTNEVSDIMSGAPGVKEVNVYGVEVQGSEGRAGMMVALLQEDTELDCAGVYKYACDCLASYARPLFIRVKKELELTGTFKQKKVQLAKEGCNPKNVGEDAIYYMDHHMKCYSPLTQSLYDDIIDNKIRL